MIRSEESLCDVICKKKDSLGCGSIRYNTTMIFNLLCSQPLEANIRITPSNFLKEMMMSFEERLKRMKKFQFKKESFYPHYVISQYFKAVPRFVFIQSFEVGKHYVIPLEIQSKAQMLKSLRISSENNRHFSVLCTSKLVCKVAPGMSIKYNINFFPTSECDYFYEICFESEDESFIVPIIALSPRPLLDFPDQVYFESTPVKIMRSKTIYVKNIGSVQANFSCITHSPFSVEPSKGILAAGEGMKITFQLLSRNVGEHSNSLRVIYENGEELTISLKGSVSIAPIEIDKDYLIYPSTYMMLQEKLTVHIINGSDYMINFHWQKNPDIESDILQMEKLKKSLSMLKDTESFKCNKLKYHDLINEGCHTEIWERIYHDTVTCLSSDDFEFNSNDFLIIPKEGELWPHSSVEITVIFTPSEPKTYLEFAYCEITGLDKRLTLKMEGTGIGPDIQLNISSLNISSVSLCSEQTFEILVKNCGDIPGEVEYECSESHFGGKITCTPNSNYLLPDETKVFFITFSSTMRGEFIEELNFLNVKSKKKLSFLLLGKVLCPTIYFGKDSIDFGEVPLGFPVEAEVPLINESLVPVAYSLFVMNDGYQRAITCVEFANLSHKGPLPSHPKEFIVVPSKGAVCAGQVVKIKITFIPNSYRSFSTSLILDLVDTQQETIMLTILGSAVFPSVVVSPRYINLPFAFINHRYFVKIVLTNKSNAPGYFHILLPKACVDCPLLYIFSVNEGMINANQIIEIQLEIIVNELGDHREEVKMLLFGEQIPQAVISIICTGQGPVVTVTPNVLNYGEVELLKNHALTLSMVNDAPIVAEFTAVFDERFNYSVTISPDHGVLQSNESCALLVTLKLCDSGPTNDNLVIKVKDSRAIVINIFAIGIGTGIVIEPKIYPVFALGKLASKKHYSIPLSITNYCSKLHTLYWTRDAKCRSQVLQNENVNWKHFKFDPNKVDVLPQQKTSTTLHILSSSDKEVSELFYTFAVISNRGSRFVLNTSVIKAIFISPGIELSEPNLYFRIDVRPWRKVVSYEIKSVTLCNRTDRPALTNLKSMAPFYVLDPNDEKLKDLSINLEANSESTIRIMFDPGVAKNSFSVIYKGVLKYVFRDIQDEIQLTGEVNFPNINVSQTKISLGYLTYGTGASAVFALSNTGVLSANYLWNVFMKSTTLELPNAEREFSQSNGLGTSSFAYRSKSSIQFFCSNEIEEDVVAPFTNRDYILRKLMICNDSNLVRNKLKGIINCFLSGPQIMKIKTSILAKISNSLSDYCQVLDILPSKGILDGKSFENVTVGFWPEAGTSYEITAYCHILGGPMEKLTITGGSSTLQFSLDKDEINFGCSSYCDIHVRSINIKNYGEIALNFVIEYRSESEFLETMRSDSTSTAGSLINSFVNSGLFFVEPVHGIVKPNSNFTFTITYYPSVSLELDSSFILQVNQLNPIIIKVKGYGVMPQVSINLPHSLSSRIPMKLMYFAVAQLTASFFSFSGKSGEHMSEAFIPPKEYEDWVFVTFQDEFPSVIDIDLAIERAIVFSFIEESSNTQNTMVLRSKTLQNIVVPEYVVDFGYVVVETVVHQTIIVRNGGLCAMPLVSVVLPYQKKIMNTKNDLNLEYRQAYGSEEIVIFATLSPKMCNFQNQIQNLNFIFHVEVGNGLRIPVRIIGVITMPYLTVCSRMLNFKDILCGEKKMIPISLKNDGYVPCYWTMSLKSAHAQSLSQRSSAIFTPFSTDVSTGRLEAQETQIVEVYFQPLTKGKYDDHLVVTLKLNPDPIRIHILGYGTEPLIEISETYLKFDTTSPYPQNLSKCFTVYNSGKTPVEIYLPDFDSLLLEEEAALRVLCLLYGMEELLLTKEVFSTSLSPKVIDFYRKLVEKVQKDVGASNISSGVNQSGSSDDRSLKISGNDDSKDSSGPSVHSKTESSCRLPSGSFDNAIYEHIAAKKDRYQLLIETEDPLKVFDPKCSKKLLEMNQESMSPQKMLIFHGAPSTDYVVWANKAATNLSCMALNFDQLIFEELIESRSQSAVHVRQFIEEAYFSLLVKSPENEDDEVLEDPDVDDNPYYELIRKFCALLIYKDKAVELLNVDVKGRKKSAQLKPGSKITSAKPASKKVVAKGEYNYEALLLGNTLTFMNIPEDFFIGIIRSRLGKMSNGVVIESLNSLFVNDVTKVLTMLLSVGSVFQSIHFIFLFDSLESFVKRCIEKQEKIEEGIKVKNLTQVHDMDEMSADEFDKQDPESKKMFRDAVLAERRNNFKEKKYVAKEQPKSPKSHSTKTPSREASKKSTKDHNKDHLVDATITYKIVIPEFMKGDSELMEKISKFEKFENDFIIIKYILEYWDRTNISDTFVNELLRNANLQTGMQAKKTKPSTKKSSTSDAKSAKEITKKICIGINTWILNHRKDYTQYVRNLCKVVASAKDRSSVCFDATCMKEVRSNSYNTSVPSLTIAVKKPEPRKPRAHCHEFIITDCPSENLVPEKYSLVPKDAVDLKKRQSRSKSELKQSVARVDEDIITKVAVNESRQSSEEGKTLTARVLLKPNDTHTWIVSFLPQVPGFYEDEFVIGVARGKKNYVVKCGGLCDIPRIDTDPSAIFSQVLDVVTGTTVSESVYIRKTGKFYFGPVMAKEERSEGDLGLEAHFKFCNISELSIDMKIDFYMTDDQNSKAFGFEPKSLKIDVNSNKKISVWAKPRSAGTHTATLIYVIKNNPEPGFIKITCIGVKPDFKIEPKLLAFERILLHRKDCKVVRLVNDCYLPLKWVFIGAMTFDPDITILPPSGIIEPLATKDVFLEYISTSVQNTKKLLDVEIYDVTGLQELLFSEQVVVKIESYDVLIDVIFIDSEYKYINFDKIKVDEIVQKTFSLKNKGNYAVLFSIELEKIAGLSVDPKEIFAIDPQHGNLGPNGKSVNIEIMCLCTSEVFLKESPIIRVSITDTVSVNSLVAVIPIGVSLRSYFSSYEIAPQYDINFGPMHVSSKKELHIHIVNTGLFNFNYKFVNSAVPINDTVHISLPKPEPPEPGKKSATGTNPLSSRKSTTIGKKKEKIPPVKALQMGPFLITKPDGLLPPGSAIDVVVECNSPTLGEITEDIRICISESKIKGGIPMKLLAHGCLPQINFSDTEFIFQDAVLRDGFHSFRANEKVKNPKTYFLKDDNTVIFYNTIVGSTAKLDLHLHNSELLATNVTSTVTSENACFSVSPVQETICPHSTKCITVSFSPVDLELVNALLEINAGDHKTLSVNLRGEGVFPHVEIIKPPNQNLDAVRMIFLPLILQTSTLQPLSFQNTGSVPCSVIIEIIGNDHKTFSLLPCDDTLSFIDFWDEKVGMEYTTIVNLPPDCIANFNMKFTPSAISIFNCEIKLFVRNNPYENLSVLVSGSGYMDEIIFENLTRLPPEKVEELKMEDALKNLFEGNVLSCYQRDFGYCHISCPQGKMFKMCNFSAKSIYRYEWTEHPNYNIEPNISFIYPGGFKDLNIIHLSDERRTPKFVDYLVCTLTKVEFPDEMSSESLRSFNASIQVEKEFLIELSSSLSSLSTSRDLKFNVLEGSWQTVILEAIGVVDVPVITTDTQNIFFPDTLLFEHSTYELNIKNEGYVPLIYEWKHKHSEPKYAEKTGIWKRNGASLMSVGAERPHILPLLKTTPRRPATALIPSRPISAIRKFPRPLSSSISLLRSSAVDKSEKLVDIMEIESGNHTFCVTPISGIIQPLSSQIFCFKFSPLRLYRYSSVFIMKFIQKLPDNDIRFELEGTAKMPLCHLVVNESNCVSTGAHQPSMPIEPHTIVLEVNVLGVGVPITKRFDILNPTDEPYTFIWDKCDTVNKSHFKCNTMTGSVEPRKQTEVSFSFLPYSAGVYDSLWKLNIPHFHLIQPVLFVGRASEPRAYFSAVHLHMKPTLIGVRVVDYVNLINAEKIDLEFKIDTTFLVGNDTDRHQISVQPMSGVISAESELELKIEVTPKYGGEEMFLVKCTVKRCKIPLKLNVHIDTFTVLPCLIHEISSKQRTELHHSKINRITLDNMLPRIPQSLTFVLLNMGKPSFIYTWEDNEDQIKRSKIELCFSRRTGIVTSQSREYISINITVLSKVTFKDILVSLKISKGPQYNILFSGTGEIPSYEFSFSEYNFGSHFICNRDDESFYKTQLYVMNRDEDPIIVETLFVNNEVFQLNVPSNGIVKPRGQIEIVIIFRPKEQKKYREDIIFTINGMFNHKVAICGHGYHSKMVLAKLSDKLVNFGAVLVGQSVTKCINLLNKCPAAGDIYLTTVPSENIPFTFEPSESELMKPHGSIKYHFTYSPTSLMKPFTVQVYMNSVDLSEPLCIVKGSAIGPSFCLDRDYIPFGCVVVGCSSSVKFILLNNGDIGSKFAWDCNKPLSWTTVSPSCGYISPGSQIKFIVKFTPDWAVSYFRKEVLCNIDAYNKPLKLVLTGSSIAAPPPTETIKFSCPVRKSDHKTINIHNSQGEMWTVYPIFKGEGFTGSQTITINSMNDAVYEIAYTPVSMTTTTSQHQGTLFFPFPDGTCKLYGLIGEATPPEAEDSFLWRIPAKVNVTQEVILINWLKVSQRFEMTNDIESQESYNLIFSIKGMKYTDVGPSLSRMYHLTLHSYREGKVKVKLYFTNETTREYKWFDITVIVDPPLPLADLTMKTKIRDSVKKSIPLFNSLMEPVTFNFTSNISYLTVEESTLTIESGQQGEMVLIYSPILVQEETTEIVVISSEQLGNFLYRVNLIAEEPIPEKTVILSAEIGRKTVVPLTVVNMSPSKAEFSCEPDHQNLSITSKISVETEQTGELSLTFEPTEEGTITKCLKVHSDSAGTFYFPIIANGCLPKPRGPYIIKQGQTIDFVIKNVFNITKKYKCFVDCPAFVVKNPEFTIQPKKEAKIQVSMVKNQDLYPRKLEFPVTGKLQVLMLHGSSQTLLLSQNVYSGQFTWIYYLKGVSDILK